MCIRDRSRRHPAFPADHRLGPDGADLRYHGSHVPLLTAGALAVRGESGPPGHSKARRDMIDPAEGAVGHYGSYLWRAALGIGYRHAIVYAIERSDGTLKERRLN